jgi:hypothetical protein
MSVTDMILACTGLLITTLVVGGLYIGTVLERIANALEGKEP